MPYVKTGGLADVGGALPKALAECGCEVKVFLPLYRSIDRKEHDLQLMKRLANASITLAEKAFAINIYKSVLPDSDVQVLFVDCPPLYDRPDIYTNDSDEDERFILLQLAVIHVLQELGWAPDVVHCHDWQTALLPVYLKEKFSEIPEFLTTTSVLSIHNVAYQGRFARESVEKAGLPYHHFHPGGPFEMDNMFCFLKTGICFADVISTVSETYAREIQTHEYGAGLDGVLAERKSDLFGILNGIDTSLWNPKTDHYLQANFSLDSMSNKGKNKMALLESVGLPYVEGVPTIGIVSRLAGQKGFDLLEPIVDRLMELPLQFVVLGVGEEKYQDFFRRCAQRYPKKFSTTIGFDNRLAHLITGGCDIFMMPSSYEPCGLNQMYSLNYGTVPVVRRTGGLADTVKDYHEYYKVGNGFTFNDYTAEALHMTIQRALDLFMDKKVWQEIMRRGMQADFSWKASALSYMDLYQTARGS
ncbi:glycogen synthase GlgA [bacterium]|nr:glycogen synthase GlgA [bacterium]